METTFFFKNMSVLAQDKVQEYMGKKISRLRRLTSKMPTDGVNLRVSCERFAKHSAFQVEMVLRVLSKRLVAKEASHTVTKSVDMAFDRLIAQLKKAEGKDKVP